MSLVDEIEKTLNKYPLIGCSCCVSTVSYERDYPDGCPIDEDGDVDHAWGPECKDGRLSRPRILAELVAEMLNKRASGD